MIPHVNVKWTTLAALLSLAGCLAPGCTHYTQRQVFGVKDELTGVTNYYEMVMKGDGGDQYRMQAGYFSSVAVDALRGSMPSVPTLDLPIEREEVFDQILDAYGQSLIQAANGLSTDASTQRVEQARKDLSYAEQQLKLGQEWEKVNATSSTSRPTTTPSIDDRVTARNMASARLQRLEQMQAAIAGPGSGGSLAGAEDMTVVEARLMNLARLAWYGSLSDADVIAMGQTQNSDPYAFRKLVFWSAVKTTNLQESAEQIEKALSDSISIANAMKAQRKATTRKSTSSTTTPAADSTS